MVSLYSSLLLQPFILVLKPATGKTRKVLDRPYPPLSRLGLIHTLVSLQDLGDTRREFFASIADLTDISRLVHTSYLGEYRFPTLIRVFCSSDQDLELGQKTPSAHRPLPSQSGDAHPGRGLSQSQE